MLNEDHYADEGANGWKLRGLCNKIEPEYDVDDWTRRIWHDIWFSESAKNVKKATEICKKCPVRLKCLQESIEKQEEFGIFGGLKPRERRKFLRKHRLSLLTQASSLQTRLKELLQDKHGPNAA